MEFHHKNPSQKPNSDGHCDQRPSQIVTEFVTIPRHNPKYNLPPELFFHIVTEFPVTIFVTKLIFRRNFRHNIFLTERHNFPSQKIVMGQLRHNFNRILTNKFQSQFQHFSVTIRHFFGSEIIINIIY